MAYLEIVGIRKTFGEVVALDEVTLSIERGEFFTLLGPSGCGKTTLLRIVAGFETPDRGSVQLEGEEITEVPPNRRNMGMVFQAYSLFPNMTAEENVEFGLRVRGWPAAERARRVAELFDLIGLSAARKRYPFQLSGGEQQRVALARALAIEPKVLLLDEPLSALDAKIRVQLREEIRAIQKRLGITTLYVTHDQEEAMAISDRVAVLSHGRIEQIGPPAEIYENPLTPFVASFVGTMNRLEGTVQDGREGLVNYRGIQLRVNAARGRDPGTRVFVFIRPEVVEVRLVGEGDGLKGRIFSQSFMGPVTRLRIALDQGGELIADIPSARAKALTMGMEVIATFPPDAAGILNI
ncbi:MAG: ABC transporter ATP-binding protein [Armatimonadota bacterium]|nr:ABC transporter ATP-binding protein [Armatimonadota bacterium]